MHILDEIELSVPWLVINFLWVVVVLHCKHLDIVRVSIVMAAKKPILFSPQPSLPKGKLSDIAKFRVDLKMDIVGRVHV